jgi:hypothetical protein
MLSITTRPAAEHEIDAYFALRDGSMSWIERLIAGAITGAFCGGLAMGLVALARLILNAVQSAPVSWSIVWYSGGVVAALVAALLFVGLSASGTKREPQNPPKSVQVVRATADAAWIAPNVPGEDDEEYDEDNEFYVAFRVEPGKVFVVDHHAVVGEIAETTERIGSNIEAELIGPDKDRVTLTLSFKGETIPLIPIPDETPGLSILRDYVGRAVDIDDFNAELRAEFRSGQV